MSESKPADADTNPVGEEETKGGAFERTEQIKYYEVTERYAIEDLALRLLDEFLKRRRIWTDTSVHSTPNDARFLHEVALDALIAGHKNKSDEWVLALKLLYLIGDYEPSLILKALEARNEKIHVIYNETISLAQLEEGFEKQNKTMDELAEQFKNAPTTIHLRIVEEPLTPQNLALTVTVLTELTTKFWLTAKRRFTDLIEYTQTHNIRFAHEAGTVITKVSYNSPFNFFWKVDLSAPSVAEALVTTLDGIKQRDVRQQKAELENLAKELEIRAKAQQIEEAKQKAEHEQEMAELDRKIKELEFQQRQAELMFQIEQQRAELLERTLEMLNKNRINAAEIAGNAVNILLPDGDAATKLMLSQSLMPDILQLQEIKGLELVPPEPPLNSEENNTKADVIMRQEDGTQLIIETKSDTETKENAGQ